MSAAPVAAHGPSEAAERLRFDRLDALRGFAIVWMAAFHFSFDLNYFRFIHQDFYRDPFWTVQRACIVTLFMVCVGAGQAIASSERQSLRRFWQRWAQIAGCAVLVTLGSALMFPRSFISFGVLHGIAVMLIAVRFTTSWGGWRWPLGLVAIMLPKLIADPFFDSRWTNWVGLVTHLPVTEDYAPLLPWLGVVWWGAAAADWLLAHRRTLLTGALPRVLRPLAVLGRWSLSFYMLHQPVLIGLLWLVAVALRR
ncbi:MAG TPA: heparan-alpha-glucosaminide N-acetyltransferase [Caldimonas sp.]|nr:heparan-alpha-glucosaminide N-acetyltransferase [Caldimonas sp.]HEX4233262.1 heparan-alpha-glucosaminide N-acetyltransferase [Caldimonas sp.]